MENTPPSARICSKSKCKNPLPPLTSDGQNFKTCERCRNRDRNSLTALRKRKREGDHLRHPAPTTRVLLETSGEDNIRIDGSQDSAVSESDEGISTVSTMIRLRDILTLHDHSSSQLQPIKIVNHDLHCFEHVSRKGRILPSVASMQFRKIH